MAIPLLWLGAAALSAYAVKEVVDDRKLTQQQRSLYKKARTLTDLTEHESFVATYPSDVFTTQLRVAPVRGSVVCCGIGGLLDHSGLWLGDDTIVELDGKGLIKGLSSQRFIAERSGKQIFIACDSTGSPLANHKVARVAEQQIFQYRDYDLINNNCHQFIWQCFNQEGATITSFKTLSQRLAQYYNRVVYWDLCAI